jgi:hypothetical protein
VMRSLQLSYASALSLAQQYRPLIQPNSGFERQLRIWEFCKYEIKDGEGREKKPYVVWKAERDELVGKGVIAVNRARFSAMGRMAAELGKKRLKSAETSDSDNPEDAAQVEKRKESWKKVEDMEKEWNKRLISGQWKRDT